MSAPPHSRPLLARIVAAIVGAEGEPPAQLSKATSGTTVALAAAYAAALAVLERRLPIKPSWVCLEVIGGVLIVGLPVMSHVRAASRSGAALGWREYESLVLQSFIAAGVPILIWQAVEYAALPRAR